MNIVGRALTACQIDPSGDSVNLGFEGVDGRPASLRLPVECLNALLMTLPRLIEKALMAKYQDGSLKVVYPTGGWTLEAASGGDRFILTLTTPDGFKVSFALSPDDAAGLATSLADGGLDPDGARAAMN